ncbi:hypothetical protein B0H14DRAFT_3647611 [Mycena olivaceomarginata]|nr:hypothetical protein B0H14DRAFT_3647611 [Mycena olivaceomarginata]
MSSTDPDYGTATFTEIDQESYTDSNSLEEVEATLNDLDDELDNTEQTLSQWSSSYTGSPSFVSLPSFGSPPPLQPHTTRLSRITERTEESRPSSIARRPLPSIHSRASTEPGLPPPGRATELIAVFESVPARASTPTLTRAVSPFPPSDSYPQGFHSTFGSRPASPTKGARVTSPVRVTSPSRTRPSMSTLLSQPPMSPTRSDTFTRSETFTRSVTPSDTYTRSVTPSNTNTYTRTDTFTPSNTYSQTGTTTTHTPSNTNTYTRTFTPTNTDTYSTATGTHTPPASLRRPAQGSPRSPLASVRNIVALWKERTPTRDASPKHSSSSSSSSSSSEKKKSASEKAASDEGPQTRTEALPPDDGLFGLRARTPSLRRRASGGSTPSAPSLRRGSAPSLRASGASSALPPSLNVAELSAYAQSNEAPLHIGLLWFLNVHAPPPFRWQRCQALLYPHLLLLSWLAPGGGRGIVGLDLVNCEGVQSTPSLGHPGAREDVGGVAAREGAGEYFEREWGGERWYGEERDAVDGEWARTGRLDFVGLMCSYII